MSGKSKISAFRKSEFIGWMLRRYAFDETTTKLLTNLMNSKKEVLRNLKFVREMSQDTVIIASPIEVRGKRVHGGGHTSDIDITKNLAYDVLKILAVGQTVHLCIYMQVEDELFEIKYDSITDEYQYTIERWDREFEEKQEILKRAEECMKAEYKGVTYGTEGPTESYEPRPEKKTRVSMKTLAIMDYMLVSGRREILLKQIDEALDDRDFDKVAELRAELLEIKLPKKKFETVKGSLGV